MKNSTAAADIRALQAAEITGSSSCGRRRWWRRRKKQSNNNRGKEQRRKKMTITKKAAEDDEFDSGDGIEIQIEKTGTYGRRISSKVVVQTSLQTMWDVLTDYERLADFIPGLAVSQLVEKGDKFARVFQIGEQKLALGLKFNAKATIDCFEKDIQMLPSGRKRDIEFKMIEGDFNLFEGKWSIVEQLGNAGYLQNDSPSSREEAQTTLMYIVNVESKIWLPVRLVEGRLCKEIRTNMSSLRKEAEKMFQNMQFA